MLSQPRPLFARQTGVRIVIFGLSISSSWGNGHATLWRGLLRALARRGHHVSFFERDVSYYARHRDLPVLPWGALHLYTDWNTVLPVAERELSDADVAIVTSYCPDAIPATWLILEHPRVRSVFYDLDSPITLERLSAGETVPYLPEHGLGDFDLVLSYAGGATIDALRDVLGAHRIAPLYGSVEPAVHHPVDAVNDYLADLSYLGTYAADRQAALEMLFVGTAGALPSRRFLLGGAQYPVESPWSSNIYFKHDVPPAEHASFYCSSRLMLNVTRRAMAAVGYCPSGRLFEATACGAPIITDAWPGIEEFFTPGEEILVARSTDDAIQFVELSDHELARVGSAGRERTLAEHTAESRAVTLESLLEGEGDLQESGVRSSARRAT